MSLKAFFNLEEYQKYRCFLLTFNNAFSFGFKNQLLLSNTRVRDENIDPNHSYINLIPYDHKNKIEHFERRTENEEIIFFEVEKQVLFDRLPALKANSTNTNSPPKCISKEKYLLNVNRLKENIQQGDIYEINYCIPYIYENIFLDPFSVYKNLNLISQAPYSALAKFDDLFIISSSPERFLQKQKSKLITQPIKGTGKRSADSHEDLNFKNELLESLKERTENIMIVDVARNDLSRIASKGSVKVEKLYEIQSYKQVHQMVSTISCELKEGARYRDIIQATFPMASMTGAPKIRAMQLIDDLEDMPRGFYSGALGYIEKNGDFDLSVLIRTIFYDEKKKMAWFWVGSAITALSDPEKEYNECLLKARAMKEVLA